MDSGHIPERAPLGKGPRFLHLSLHTWDGHCLACSERVEGERERGGHMYD